jgi:hypothetical protein
MWEDAGRIAAGYTMRGLIAGLHVTRARQEPSPEAERMFRLTCARYAEASAHAYGVLGGYADGDLSALEAYLRARPPGYPSEMTELFAGALADAAIPVDEKILERTLADWGAKVPLVAAQCRRVLGLQRRDPALLVAAEEAYDRLGAVPAGARARFELGVMTGDPGRVDAAVRVLEELGDRKYLERHLRDVQG